MTHPVYEGTPQTLKDAIKNGLNSHLALKGDLAGGLEMHVRDFLAQKFSGAVMGEIKTFEDLWFEITGKRI